MLLLLLITAYLLSAFFSGRWINDLQLGLFTVAGLLAIRNSLWRRRRIARLVIAAAFVVSLLIVVIADHLGGLTGLGAASAWTGVLLLLIVVAVVRQILAASLVTLQSIYGAISAYLIIGLMFSAFYSAMYYLHDRTFFAQAVTGNVRSVFQYFSFTTLTTLGYGDFTAASSGGRAVAMLEAMTGQIFLATLVAKLVASFRPAAASGGAGGAGGTAED